MEEKKLIRTSERMFLNSKAIFVEYIDIIKAPYFFLLDLISKTKDGVLKEPFDISEIKGKDDDSLLQWYYLRKNQNFFMDLIPDDKRANVHAKDVDEFMNYQLEKCPDIVQASKLLPFGAVLQTLLKNHKELVGSVYIYHPFKNSVIEDDVKRLYPYPIVNFVSGDLNKIIEEEIPTDTTYVFSDITNIIVLDETKHLDFSSIILAKDYGYNQTADGEPKINMAAYSSDHTFKVDYFFATV